MTMLPVTSWRTPCKIEMGMGCSAILYHSHTRLTLKYFSTKFTGIMFPWSACIFHKILFDLVLIFSFPTPIVGFSTFFIPFLYPTMLAQINFVFFGSSSYGFTYFSAYGLIIYYSFSFKSWSGNSILSHSGKVGADSVICDAWLWHKLHNCCTRTKLVAYVLQAKWVKLYQLCAIAMVLQIQPVPNKKKRNRYLINHSLKYIS